jgi:hypothetical protein
MPFAVHQVLEYALAAVLAETSVHLARGGLLLGAAVGFALLGLSARGPFGVFRVCGARLHAALDVAAALALAAAPAIPALRPDPVGIVTVELVAAAWIRLATLTRYRPAHDGRGTPSSPSVALVPVGDPAPGPARAAGTGAAVARGLGTAARLAQARLPEVRATLGDAARHGGRMVRAWRQPRDGPP